MQAVLSKHFWIAHNANSYLSLTFQYKLAFIVTSQKLDKLHFCFGKTVLILFMSRKSVMDRSAALHWNKPWFVGFINFFH